MDTSHEPTSKFDPAKIITQGLAYLKYGRLMLLMLLVGILAGVCYFLYSTPLFEARSLVYFQVLGTALKNKDVPETLESQLRVSRGLLTRFPSRRIQIGAAQRLGLVGESATYGDVADHVTKVQVSMVDLRHMQVTVLANDPEVVRNFCEAMVEEFQEFQKNSWEEFRDQAMDLYAVQLSEIDKKVSESAESLSQVERDQRLTEVTIEQQSLLEIPKMLVDIRERLARMEKVQSNLQELDSEGGGLSPGANDGAGDAGRTLSALSLLSSFEKEVVAGVGDVVRKTTPGMSGSIMAARRTQSVVVQPSNIEGIESWRELEKQKRVLEIEIENASQKYLPEHPVMKELTGKLDDTNQSLVSELQVLRAKFHLDHERLKEKLTELTSRMPEYYDVTEKLGKSAIAYNTVEQTQVMWSKARALLSDKLAAITFSGEYDWVQMRFKGHTTLRDEDPVSPSKKKLFMLSILIGLAGAVGLPTILNLLNTSASTIQQLEEYTGLRGMGIVPLSNQEDLESVHRSPAQGADVPNYLLECFRLIRANICLHPGRDEKSQVVLVTSARPQEGKTTQSANLAWAFHSMGERVLLIDCDLRRGRIHNLLGIDKAPGATKMLMGEVSPGDAVVHTRLKGFDVIPRGPVIAGTTELLCQTPFEELINYWRNHYDRIILDCPPTLGLSESSSLQRLADGVVMVVRSEKTPVKDVLDAVTLLRKTGAHFFGFVLNGVDLSKAGNYYHYYYYSAPYYDQFEEDDQDEPEGDFSTTL